MDRHVAWGAGRVTGDSCRAWSGATKIPDKTVRNLCIASRHVACYDGKQYPCGGCGYYNCNDGGTKIVLTPFADRGTIVVRPNHAAAFVL